MTNFTYTNNFTSSTSLSTLKAYCNEFNITVTGDKRRKASYLEAIELNDAKVAESPYADYEYIHSDDAYDIDAREQHRIELECEMAIAEGIMTVEEARAFYYGEDDYETQAENGDHDAIAQLVDAQKELHANLKEHEELQDELEAIAQSTEVKVGFAPLLMLVLQFMVMVVALAVYLVDVSITIIKMLIKKLNLVRLPKINKPKVDFYQQTKDMLSDVAIA